MRSRVGKLDLKARRHVRGILFIVREEDRRFLLGKLRRLDELQQDPVLMPCIYEGEPDELGENLRKVAAQIGITDLREPARIAKLAGENLRDPENHIYEAETGHRRAPDGTHEFEEFGWYLHGDVPNAFYNKEVLRRFFNTGTLRAA